MHMSPTSNKIQNNAQQVYLPFPYTASKIRKMYCGTAATAIFNVKINKVNAKMTWNTIPCDGNDLEMKVYQKSLKTISCF
jgi:hypothetical protein